MFVPKKGGGLRLCVDYRGLNKITLKNRTPLPLISETLDRLGGAKIFTKLDLKDAYHRLRIRRGDEWKTAFRTRYGHFEYCVLPFGLSNAPATFQAYINQALVGLVDVTCVVYLDDILVYSENPAEHTTVVRQILERLQQAGLFANLKKCVFDTDTVEFLGFVISPAGITMEASRVSAIVEWPAPTSIREVQVFLGFANFYRRFIQAYSRVAKPISDLLRTKEKSMIFEWTKAAEEAFQSLKASFTTAPILRHFDPGRPIRVETDASGFAVAGILSQFFEEGAHTAWHPIAYFSKKMSDTEGRYETHDSELLAIVMAFRIWRHYLAHSRRTIVVKSDHHNLKYFMTKRKLNGRQARWAEELAAFDFVLEYRSGSSNPADGPSRRPDHHLGSGLDSVQMVDLSSKLRTVATVSCSQSSTECTLGKDFLVPGSGLDSVQHLGADGNPKRTRLPTLHEKLRAKEGVDFSLLVAIMGRHVDVPANPQSKGQERGGRRSSTGNCSGSDTPSVDHLFCDGVGDASPLLEPVAGVAGCKQYIPRIRAMSSLVVGSETAYTQSATSLLELLAKLQETDHFVQRRKYESYGSCKRAGDTKTWDLDANNLLRYRGAVYVPNDSALRDELLKVNHDDPLAGHFGAGKTLELMRRKYFWQNMKKDIRDYVRTCPVCQRTKAKRHLPFGELASFPIPAKPWDEITLDFITGLPPSKFRGRVYDSILVIVDRYTKLARYILTTKEITAPELAELFVIHVFKDFGLPKGMTSDRGSVFTSKFWASLCFYLTIRRRLSTAFHPQTDGQTENLNQTLEHYLRSYCCYHQDDWATKLALAEFTYNNSMHSTTGISPFFAMYGFHPTVDFNVEDNVPAGGAPAAAERVELIRKERQRLQIRWQDAVKAQKLHHDKKHIPRRFKVSDKVLLRAKNIKQLRPSGKLADKYLGPFEIVEAIGEHGQAFRLKLPPSYKIHDVFHVSLLEPWHSRVGAAEEPRSVEIEGVEEYEVESVQAHREQKKGREYLVRWKGYAPADDTWEAAGNLEHAQEAVQEYLQKSKKPMSKRRKRKYN